MTPQITTDTELPVVHLNGTGLQTLLGEYKTALRSLEQAKQAVLGTTCHGRDYYPKGDTAYLRAHSQRQAAIYHLNQTISYVESHVEHLYNEQQSRASRHAQPAAQNRSLCS